MSFGILLGFSILFQQSSRPKLSIPVPAGTNFELEVEAQGRELCTVIKQFAPDLSDGKGNFTFRSGSFELSLKESAVKEFLSKIEAVRVVSFEARDAVGVTKDIVARFNSEGMRQVARMAMPANVTLLHSDARVPESVILYRAASKITIARFVRGPGTSDLVDLVMAGAVKQMKKRPPR